MFSQTIYMYFVRAGLKLEQSENVDDFALFKKQAEEQLQEARKLLEERDALFAVSSHSRGKESVDLSSKIRAILREAKDSHKKMQIQPTKVENDLAYGKVVRCHCECVGSSGERYASVC